MSMKDGQLERGRKQIILRAEKCRAVGNVLQSGQFMLDEREKYTNL